MTLPKQIQDQLDEANRIEEAILAEQEAEAAQEAPAPVTPPEEKPVAESDVPPTPEPEASTPPPSEDDKWEKRFKTLKGKYDAEVPRMSAELKELRSHLTQLSDEAKAKPKELPKPLVDEKDVETFGADLLDVIDRKAREVAGSMVGTEMAELKAENQQLRERLDGVAEHQVASNRQTYFAQLAQVVPDWEAVNVDEGFIDWLAQTDPLSGSPRQAYLETAFNGYDVTRTAALFNTFKQMTAPADPAQPQAAKNRELERQVAPGTSKASASTPNANPADRIWKLREIETFYNDVAKGKYSDNPDEAKRVENEIDLAAAAGRVRP